MICYSENEPRSNAFSYSRLLHCDATERYLSHYSNYLFLHFMMKKGNFKERTEASKELAICERKMTFWTRMPSFQQKLATQNIEQLKRKWRV